MCVYVCVRVRTSVKGCLTGRTSVNRVGCNEILYFGSCGIREINGVMIILPSDGAALDAIRTIPFQ